MKQLAEWALTSRVPGFYDVDSGTSIEQTAKVYQAMRDLIDEYNTASTNLEKAINDHKADITKEFECFKSCVSKMVENYIKTVEIQLAKQDKKIEEVDNKITDLQFDYDELTESLNIGGV